MCLAASTPDACGLQGVIQCIPERLLNWLSAASVESARHARKITAKREEINVRAAQKAGLSPSSHRASRRLQGSKHRPGKELARPQTLRQILSNLQGSGDVHGPQQARARDRITSSLPRVTAQRSLWWMTLKDRRTRSKACRVQVSLRHTGSFGFKSTAPALLRLLLAKLSSLASQRRRELQAALRTWRSDQTPPYRSPLFFCPSADALTGLFSKLEPGL